MRFLPGFALAAACVSTASAAPISLYFSFDGSTYNAISTFNSASSPTTNVSVLVENPTTNQTFTALISTGDTGAGSSAGDGSGFFTNVSVVSGATGGLLYLAAIESGLPGRDASTFSGSFSNSATSTVSVGERLLLGQTVTPAGMSLLAATLAPGNAEMLQTAAQDFPNGYAIGERYRIDFGPGAGTATASIAEQRQGAAAVTPEPCSLALLGTGVLGAVGVVRRRFV